MIDIIKCVTGLLLFMYELEELSASSKIISNCTVTIYDDGDERANCSNRGLTSIPQNLPESITWLDISNNGNIKSLEKSALRRYPLLKKFTMKRLKQVKAFPRGFFKHSTQLVNIGMGWNIIKNLKEIPRSVTFFNYTEYPYSSIDLSHLINLDTLRLREGNLTRIPILDEETRSMIEIVDLKFNPLTDANYTHIAPFCNLKFFGLNSTELRNEKYVDQCCGFVKWLKFALSPNGIGYKFQGCSCKQSDCNDTSVCDDFVLDQSAKDAFNACKRKYTWKLTIVGILGFFLVGLCMALAVSIVHHLYIVGTFDRMLLKPPSKKKKEATTETPHTEVGSKSKEH